MKKTDRRQVLLGGLALTGAPSVAWAADNPSDNRSDMLLLRVASKLHDPNGLPLASRFASLEAADAAAKAAGLPVVLDSVVKLQRDTTLSAGLFCLGGQIELGNFNLTFASAPLSAPLARIFVVNGRGRVLGMPQSPEVYPDWWWDHSSDATAAFQYAADACLRAALPLRAIGRYSVKGPVVLDYDAAGGSMIQTGVPFSIDFSNAHVSHTGDGYLWSIVERGNQAKRPRLNWRMGYVDGNPGAAGMLENNSWGGNSFSDLQVTGYVSGARIFHLYNNIPRDYQENGRYHNMRFTGGGGTCFGFDVGSGKGSFSRTTFRDIFVAGTYDTVFDCRGGVYDSLFENIVGNPAGSTIFRLRGAMGGTLITKVSLEQTSPSGVCFDVSAGFHGARPNIDLGTCHYQGKGRVWEFGSSGFSPEDFVPGYRSSSRRRQRR